jgi:ribonuclease HI
VWTIHYDGAWCHAGAGAAAIITWPTGIKHRYAARPSFALESDKCTNTIAEYEAVILGLRKLRALGVTTCIVKTDSKVVDGQVEKEYSAKDPALMQYLTAVRSLERQFKGFTLHHVDRARDEEADALAKAAARGETLPSDVFYHIIGTPAVRNPEGLQVTNDTKGHRIVNLIMTEDWRAPITLFLQGYYHPNDVNEAKRLKHRSQDFVLVGDQLYKKGISQPMLKCITKTEGIQILREVHSGTCRSHSGLRALATKVICQGFYWPAIICATNRVMRSCEACQKFSPRSGNPSQVTKLIAHTWPLQRWGLDIVGPLPTAQENLKFTFDAVEYITKWIEARAVSTITSKTAQKFFWQNIVCRFGVPSKLTVDNGKQFDSQDFRDFCLSIGTKLAFASVYHLQSNGVIERANGKTFTAIKKRLLGDKKGKWADQLPEVVWALNTIECQATRFTPFRLLYGSEAMTPQEIKHGLP